MSFDTRIDTTPEVVQEETPQTLTVSQIVMDLGNGIDRTGIRKKYGLTTAELQMVFAHPKLSKLRVKKHQVIRIQLIDDTVDVNQTSIPVVEDVHDQGANVHFNTPSLEETAEMLYGVDNTNVEGTFNQRTRVEESGSDFDIDTIKAFVDKDYDTLTNQTEIKD